MDNEMMTVTRIHRENSQTESAHSRVAAFLRDQLLSGQLKAGDCLLPERELAAKLDVSRPVLREALRALAMIGAVEIRHGVGTIVTRPDITTLGEFFSFMLAHQSDALGDIMEARIAIEHHAIRLTCQRATEQDFARISGALRRIVATISDPEAGGMADYEFHEAIVQAAHSPTLTTIYSSIRGLMTRSHLERREQIMQVDGFEEFLVDHHRKILSALISRNVALADELLTRHFEIGAEFRRKATMQATAIAAGLDPLDILSTN
jgi:GntR family transcriptional regulator, transcriptional repressor for pyruvate dehydrogenase complex